MTSPESKVMHPGRTHPVVWTGSLAVAAPSGVPVEKPREVHWLASLSTFPGCKTQPFSDNA